MQQLNLILNFSDIPCAWLTACTAQCRLMAYGKELGVRYRGFKCSLWRRLHGHSIWSYFVI